MPFHLPPASSPIRRRAFLAGVAAGAGVSLCPARPVRAEYGNEVATLALVSDTHVAADEASTNLGQTMAANLRAVIADIQGRPTRPAHALFNGDLALRDGQPGDYATFLRLVAPLREAGVPLTLALGNHDERATLAAALAESTPGPVGDRRVAEFAAAGLRILALDSLLKPNFTPGLLGPRQLFWLMARLDDPAHAATPTVVVVHHHPSDQPGGLIDTFAILNLLGPRRQVKALVFGHTHRWSTELREDGLWLVNLPAVGYPFSPDQPIGWVEMRPRDGGADLELRAVGGARAKHGQAVPLEWR